MKRSRPPRSAPLSTALSRAPLGLKAPLVRVEVHVGPGLPALALVGLPEAVVRESKERVRSALQTSGFTFPTGRITVNLSPADLPKEGGRFDLPIALAILAASGQLPAHTLVDREFYGELALNGELRETSRLLPALLAGARANAQVIVPLANAAEAAWIAGRHILVARHLLEVCLALRGRAALPTAADAFAHDASAHDADAGQYDAAESPGSMRASLGIEIAEVRGQFHAKRALEIAAAAAHGLLMIGPPGAGKTLLARRLRDLLPPLDRDEALEVACVESSAGRRPSLGCARPFRSPQHTASVASLIGGALRPGELSLAHRGVLFLDELPEFAHNVLEALREPMENGVVVVSRAKRAWEFPARFQLVAAMNPCPCGYAGDPRGRCRCTAQQVNRYRNRISGPLIDRIDMHVELAAVPVEHLMSDIDPSPAIEHPTAVAARIASARNAQMQRQGKLNAHLEAGELGDICRLDRNSRALLSTAIGRLGLSARAYHRVLKVARTCADLASEPAIRRIDVAEAVKLRALDRPSAPASETTC